MVLRNAMTALAHRLLYSPDPNTTPGDWGDLNPNSIVPVGTIRAALGAAGGHIGDLTTDAPLTAPVGQVGTGDTIASLLTSAGAERHAYECSTGRR